MKRLFLIMGIFIVSTTTFAQKFESHKVYLLNSGKTNSIVKIIPVSKYNIKKDNRISWVNYEIGKEFITITASDNRTNKERSCDLILLDNEGTPLDTLQVIQRALSNSNITKTTSTVGTVTKATTSYSKKKSNSKSTKSYGGQCAATTKKGTRCSRTASPGSRYCWQHK